MKKISSSVEVISAILSSIQDLQDLIFEDLHHLSKISVSTTTTSVTSRTNPWLSKSSVLMRLQVEIQALCSDLHEYLISLLRSSVEVEGIHSVLQHLYAYMDGLYEFYDVHFEEYRAQLQDKVDGSAKYHFVGVQIEATDEDLVRKMHQPRTSNTRRENYHEEDDEESEDDDHEASNDEQDDMEAGSSMSKIKSKYPSYDLFPKIVQECRNIIAYLQAVIQSIKGIHPSHTERSVRKEKLKSKASKGLLKDDVQTLRITSFAQDLIRSHLLSQSTNLSVSSPQLLDTTQLISSLFWIKCFENTQKFVSLLDFQEAFQVEYGPQSRDLFYSFAQQITQLQYISHELLQEYLISFSDLLHFLQVSSTTEQEQPQPSDKKNRFDSFYLHVQQICCSKTLLIMSGKLKDVIHYSQPTCISRFIGIPIRQVACGDQHIAVVTNAGDLYTWGKGHFGRLGHGNEYDILLPNRVIALQNSMIEKVACGFAFTAAITNKGHVYSWGAGTHGRLGLGDNIDRYSPFHISSLEGIRATDVYAGSVHMCIMDDKGKVYSCGKAGFCGHGESNDVLIPMWLDYFDSEEVEQVSISSGGFHTLALTKSGILYSWGHCRVGQLGITMKEGMPRSEDGGYYLPVPHIVSESVPNNIAKIRAGWGHSSFITKEGKIWMCGRNAECQLGISTYDPGNSLRLNERSHLFQPTFMPISTGDLMLPKKAKDIVCGGEHTLVILENGVEVIGMGTSSDGQLFDSSYAQALPIPSFLSYFSQEHRNIVQMSAAYHITACVVEAFRQPYSLRKLCSDVILQQHSELTEWLLHPEQAVKEEEDNSMAEEKQYYRNLLLEHFC